MALGLPSLIATVNGRPVTCDAEAAFDILGVPRIEWMRVRSYRTVQWCVIVLLHVWRFGMWPEMSGLSVVHVARDGELYMAEDKQQRDSSKGGRLVRV